MYLNRSEPCKRSLQDEALDMCIRHSGRLLGLMSCFGRDFETAEELAHQKDSVHGHFRA
jgi:hypothetical protein